MPSRRLPLSLYLMPADRSPPTPHSLTRLYLMLADRSTPPRHSLTIFDTGDRSPPTPHPLTMFNASRQVVTYTSPSHSI